MACLPFSISGRALQWIRVALPALGALWFIAAINDGATAAKPDGAAIYQQKCAACHGKQGEGVADAYPQELIGDRSLLELTRYIEESMPEGDPSQCVGPEAAAVAAYIHGAFYSEVARARNKPARIELARLTVRQYEQAVADLVGSFAAPGKWDDERGLRAQFFANKRASGQRVHERRDAVVDFDFGDRPAVSGEKIKLDVNQHAASWEGGVLAEETGDYEFIIQTPNGTRLWVNDLKQPLIDAGVKSGDETEYRATIRLLGGRVHPIRLEYYKLTEPRGSIRLLWKPPHRTAHVIPERNLTPSKFPPVLVLSTPLPPDDSSIGFERGSSISKQFDEATTYAAIEVAEAVARRLPELARTGSTEDDKPLREFCAKLAARAFRRPLTDDERQFFIDRQFDAAEHAETAVQRTVLLVLKSPRFLYREAGFGQFDAYATASWLSFGIWDSLPDQPLLDAAARGQLSTREQIHQQATRMLGDLRARSKVRAFMHQWLNYDRFTDVSKDGESYPQFDEEVLSDLRQSLDLFLDDVLWSKDGDLRQLYTADYLYLNGRLAALYGAKLPANAPYEKVSFPGEQRAGILSHPYLMAGLAYHETSSPIHRGVFLARSVLGRLLKPPPEAVTPAPPHLHAKLTTRERVEMQTRARPCQSCHAMINPLGFALENYDAIGRYRERENGKPVNAEGSYFTSDGRIVEFSGVRELADFLAASPEAHAALVEQIFSYMVKQPVMAFGHEELDELTETLGEQEFNLQRLLAEMMTRSAQGAREKLQTAAAN